MRSSFAWLRTQLPSRPADWLAVLGIVAIIVLLLLPNLIPTFGLAG